MSDAHETELSPAVPDLIPARMLNEFTYCPRLAWLEYVQGEWEESPDTIDGDFVHRNADRADRRSFTPPDAPSTSVAKDRAEESDPFHARSIRLENPELGILAVVDVLEVDGDVATPIDYKRGEAPDLPTGAWDPERVQLCAQGLLLRAAGYTCTHGFIWFSASRRRVQIDFTEELVSLTQSQISQFREALRTNRMPLPLVDSPKCPRCSLVGICLPDETHLLAALPAENFTVEVPEVRPLRQLYAPNDNAKPVHIFEQGVKVGKTADRIKVENDGKKLAEIPINDIDQLCVFGNVQISTQALTELIDRQIPVCYFSYGGWFRGLSGGLPHKNIDLRIRQHAVAADSRQSLDIARTMIAGKIANCRTILRRNQDEKDQKILDSLANIIRLVERVGDINELLGMEGLAAREYFAQWGGLLKFDFDFTHRNRRPPRDPVNATLSFVYAMLTKELYVATTAVGLEPMLGFLHQPRYGRPSLALDLAEEFRPILADSITMTLFNTEELQGSHFLQRGEACTLTAAGKRVVSAAWERRLGTEVTHPMFGYKASYRRILAIQARLLARVLLGEIPVYHPFRTR
ncbi:MAG: CRISPR-associated endonuclease Cas1 [Zavarzinella sp.]